MAFPQASLCLRSAHDRSAGCGPALLAPAAGAHRARGRRGVAVAVPRSGPGPSTRGWLRLDWLLRDARGTNDFEPVFPWFRGVLAGPRGRILLDTPPLCARGSRRSRARGAGSRRGLVWMGGWSLVDLPSHQPTSSGSFIRWRWCSSGGRGRSRRSAGPPARPPARRGFLRALSATARSRS